MQSYKYYCEKLSKREKEVYLIMEKAIFNMKNEFSVPKIPFERISEIHTMIRLDSPLIFNTDALSFSSEERADSVKIKPHYTLKKKEYENELSMVKKRLLRILSDAPEKNEEKQLFIHDYIVRHVKYDKLKKQYSHEVTGPLFHGIGVCEGMSKTFKLMCDEIGIECICVIGNGVSQDRSTGKKWEKHMWNMVKISNQWLAIDVTFDSSLSDENIIRYDYYNVTDDIMMCSHSDIMFQPPKAVSVGKDYYSLRKRSFRTNDDIITAVRDAFKKPYISIFRLECNNSGQTDDIKNKIENALSRDRRSAKFKAYSVTQSQSGVVKLQLIPKDTENNEY